MTMLIRMFLCIATALMQVYSLTTFAQQHERLNGTWIVDAKASEESLMRNIPYFNGRGVLMELHLWGAFAFNFDGKMANFGVPEDPGSANKYHLDSTEGTNVRYISEKSPPSYYLTVTLPTVNQDNDDIVIIVSRTRDTAKSPMRYLFWKRMSVDPKKTRAEYFKEETDAWLALLENFNKAIEAYEKTTGSLGSKQ